MIGDQTVDETRSSETSEKRGAAVPNGCSGWHCCATKKHGLARADKTKSGWRDGRCRDGMAEKARVGLRPMESVGVRLGDRGGRVPRSSPQSVATL